MNDIAISEETDFGLISTSALPPELLGKPEAGEIGAKPEDTVIETDMADRVLKRLEKLQNEAKASMKAAVKPGVYEVHAVGTSFGRSQEWIRFTNRRASLHLERHPVEQDNNAVAIFTPKHHLMGYIPAKKAKKVGELLDKGMISVKNWNKCGGGEKSYGLYINLEVKS